MDCFADRAIFIGVAKRGAEPASAAMELPQRARDAGAHAEQVLEEPVREASHCRAAAQRTQTTIGKTKSRGREVLEWRRAPVPASTDALFVGDLRVAAKTMAKL